VSLNKLAFNTREKIRNATTNELFIYKSTQELTIFVSQSLFCKTQSRNGDIYANTK
jgi:hypothetical protein